MPGRLSGDSKYTNLKKLLVVGCKKRSILQGSVKCVLHTRSEVKLETFVNSALFCLCAILITIELSNFLEFQA